MSRKTAIVVLGAAVWPEGAPSPSLARRIARAAQLFRSGCAAVVIGSGGVGRWPPSEAEVIRDSLVAVGVPETAVLMEARSGTTFENALHTIRLMRARGLDRAILVSDAYHLPRAILTFRLLGMAATGSAAPPDSATPRLKRLWAWLRECPALPYYAARAVAWRLVNGPVPPP